MNILQSLKTNKWIQISIVAILLFILYNYKDKIVSLVKSDFVSLPMSNVNTPTKKVEGFEGTNTDQSQPQAKKPDPMNSTAVDPMEGDLATFDISGTEKQILENISTGASQLTAGDLLPKYDDANTFAKENAVTKVLKDQNFLISGYSSGIDTISSSKRIPYNDYRENILIPKDNTISPWNMSALEEGFVQRGI